MKKSSSQFPVLSSQMDEWRGGRPRPSGPSGARRGFSEPLGISSASENSPKKTQVHSASSTGGGARRSIHARRSTRWSEGFLRWLKFNFVGAIGIAVQLAALALFRSALHLNYLLATPLAVEAAVLHNFLWHERFTWADRPAARLTHSLARLARFNASNGGVSILGNLLLMRLLVGEFRLNYFAANLTAITVCSLVNFLLSDRFVFDPQIRPASVRNQ